MKRALPPPRGSGLRAFSLIEVLVACAVLAVVILLVAQVLSATGNTTAESRRRMETDKEARVALDRIAFDLARMIRREDVPLLFDKAGGNDSLSFFSEVPGKGSGSTLSQVSYRVASGGGLERAATKVDWNAIAFGGSSMPAPATGDFRMLAPSVFRLELSFLIRGDYTDPASPVSNPMLLTLAHALPTGSSTLWRRDLRSVVITIATLDKDSRAKISGQFAALAGGLPDGTATALSDTRTTNAFAASQSPVARSWRTPVESGILAGIPRPVVSEIRIYTRVVPLP